MTRAELKEAIRATGADVKLSGLTKGQLEAIYNRLRVHGRPTAPPAPPTPPKAPPQPPPVRKVVTPTEPPIKTQPVTPLQEPPVEPVEPVEPVSPVEPVEPTEPIEGEPTEGEPTEGEPSEGTPPSGDPFDELVGRIHAAEVPRSEKLQDKPLFEVTRKKKSKRTSSPDSMRVEGYVLMLVVDTVYPAAMAFTNNALDKRTKIRAEELSLSEHDFAKLEPLADQAADYLSINLNPVAGFFLIATFMYGNNLINLRMSKTVDKTK